MEKDFYITTAIAYVNNRPHIGHAYEFILADIFARYKRLLGTPVFFNTGVDEHGQKVWQKALSEGQDVRKYADLNTGFFKELTKELAISYDRFIRTTDKDHIKTAQWFWQRVKAKGDLYLKDYEGYYCVGCEEFKEEEDLTDGKCPIHNLQPEKVAEKNWFFRLSRYKKQLRLLIKENIIEIVPAHRKQELLNLLEKAQDVSVSRSKKRVPWGIPVPGDEDQVMYVWFDALLNYLTAARTNPRSLSIKKSDFERWPADLQIIGKDIFRFHAILWQAMLLSAGFSPSRKIFVHGFITLRGEKMSKTLGNVIDPFNLIKTRGATTLRYYFARYIPTTEDGDFLPELFDKAYESDLANDLGNLLQRFLVLVTKNDVNLSGFIGREERLPDWYIEKMENFQFAEVLSEIWKIIGEANRLFNKERPWEKLKTDPLKARQTLGIIYRFLLDISFFLSPFLPSLSQEIDQQLKTFQPKILFPKT
jgi:methionyl-tRNA synthetase